MTNAWETLVVTKVALALYVAPHTGRRAHTDRPFHGLILNDENSVKDYCFSDGRVMRTEGGAFFYLPKGSTYTIKTLSHGGCYAINFDGELSEEPFVMYFRTNEGVRKSFRCASEDWRRHNSAQSPAVMRAVYDIICQMQAEAQKQYSPEGQLARLAPALERLAAEFTDGTLTVASLAAECNMSEVYFRRLFLARFGVSPKEYLIQKRMEYAKQLLATGQVSVRETAELCGYAEPCQFSREFKRRVGVSPKEYS